MPSDGRKGRTACLFSAGVSPWPGSAAELADAFPVFADHVDEICARLDPYLELPLSRVLFAAAGTPTSALLERASFAGPALFALQVAQYRLLDGWGIRPDVVFGQGAGRMAAAYAAGVFRLADACHAVGTLARLLAGRPGSAAHSPGPAGILDAYGRTLATLHPRAPRLPLLSDLTARPVGAETAEPAFWVSSAPVRFAEAAGRLHRDGVRTWLELGPGDPLTRMLPGCLPDAPGAAFALVRDWRALRERTGGG
ncbi:acyltransferase domain-containing protein [Streptomyces sp. NPDC048362]|uniref:acyltransferase domain-containing protein n=1 Tax=Streptomyces sp. NPDC048362 TaxID=3365539 RepID=UPI00371E1168